MIRTPKLPENLGSSFTPEVDVGERPNVASPQYSLATVDQTNAEDWIGHHFS